MTPSTGLGIASIKTSSDNLCANPSTHYCQSAMPNGVTDYTQFTC